MADKKKEVIAIVGIILLGMAAYVMTIYLVFQESPEDAYERGYEDARLVLLDTLFNQWLNDSLDCSLSLNVRGIIHLYSTESGFWVDWYSWDISEELARSWYDGVDTTYSMYEDAIKAWAMSYLTKERTFIIYFDSTDTMPAIDRDTITTKQGLYLLNTE